MSNIKSPLQKLNKFKNLVLSGGGWKGYSYIGVYQALHELKTLNEVEHIAGSSAGAAIGLLMTIGMTPKEVKSLLSKANYHSHLKNWNFTKVLDNWGLDLGNKFEGYFIYLIKKKTGLNNPTFQEFYNYNPVKFTVVATHLNNRQAIYYNHENTPDEPVALAVRKSISIPFFMAPIKQLDEQDKPQYFIDGGMRDRFPIQIMPDSPETLGVVIAIEDNRNNNIDSFEDFIWNFLNCVVESTKVKIPLIKQSNIIEIKEIPQFASIKLDMSNEDLNIMIKHGYDTVMEYFQQN